jgi:hypothetical protein
MIKSGRKGVNSVNIDFSNRDVLLIYEHFVKEIKKLEEIKSAKEKVISARDINKHIGLYSSITDKIEAVYPRITKLRDLEP